MAINSFPTIIHLKDPNPPPNARTYIIFFITGNPGLISYYTTFLQHLYSVLSTSSSSKDITFQVYGASLSGFDVHGKEQGFVAGKAPPYGLLDQIEGVSNALRGLVTRERKGSGGDEAPRVVLMGHSVGAFILLELIRRERGPPLQRQPSLLIVGGVCLTPTVVDIARSSSGRISSVLLPIPGYVLIASLVVRFLTFWIPLRIFEALVHVVTGFPADAAAVTAAFIKSRWGVKQALHMAREEMQVITADTWDDEIWGAAALSPSGLPRSKLFFLFAKQDHWVADETRDDLIRLRARRGDGEEEWKPKMEVDESGLVHGFCIRHSVPVAEKVKGYIDEIVEADLATSTR
ncbi:hypothetical protein H2201_005883 [Coniosporium apollinis]|uniref:Lipid droplet-associated hydrolase n=1 Tax=Coniosporium apollinis TaxID=61459 RepID=A0ABQ9NP02_9PEZI|nr:hypothetical protein H2201_005883 [Coniosporium apollinis]